MSACLDADQGGWLDGIGDRMIIATKDRGVSMRRGTRSSERFAAVILLHIVRPYRGRLSDATPAG